MKRKNQLRVIALCLLVCLCISMAACGGGKDSTETSGSTDHSSPETVTYTVQIQSESGLDLENVGVFIYTDESLGDLVWFEKTNAQGQMHFTAEAGSYVAVLNNLPDGYEAEDTYPITDVTTVLQLAVGQISDDTGDVVFDLGDMMMDFTVTAPGGTEYSLSALLAEKDAVVLNFWYIGCDPCRMEFPYLQEAYEKYSDNIEVLAMNPVNADDTAIAEYQSEMGITFPMVQCSQSWESMMQLVGYPTTVVIDRYGTISLIHMGSITSTEAFEEIFAHYADENYESGAVEDLEDLTTVEPVVGNEGNPIEIGGVTSFEVAIEPGQTLYYHVYKVSGNYMSVTNKNIDVTYNGRTYEGGFGMVVTSDDISNPVKLSFRNTGTETETFTVKFSALAGTYGNPYKLELGEFTTNVSAGNNQGVYYTYTATEKGTLTLECLSVTKGVDYDYVLYNLSTSVYRNMQEDGDSKTVSVKVNKGDKVQVIISPLPDSEHNYPAAKFTSVATFSNGVKTEEEEETVELVTYAVTVTNEYRQPVSNVFVYLDVDGKQVTMQTDENGVAYTRLAAGEYTAAVKVPTGYTGRTTQFTLTERYPTVSIKLDTVVEKVMVEYTITVVDENGDPIPFTLVSVGGSFGFTDENGTVTFTLEEGTYQITVRGDNGVIYLFSIGGGATTATVTLTGGESTESTLPPESTEPADETEPPVRLVNYSVSVRDYAENPITDAVVIFYKSNGRIATMGTVDGTGVASVALEEGTYTVSVSFSDSIAQYHYDTSSIKLTAENPAATVFVAKKLSGEFEEKYFGEVYYLTEGSTYAQLQSGVVNYFLFEPAQSGLYRVSIVESDAALSYWGANMMFVTDQTSNMDLTDNSFTLNVKEPDIGNVSHILGATGDDDCIIVITRLGDAVLDHTDVEWIVYSATTPPSQYTFSGGTLTYFDLTASGYTLVKDSNGFYHLNSADGPMVLVNLGEDAPYVSMYTMLGGSGVGGTGLRKYFYDTDGNFLRKEDYTQCMLDYVLCRDAATGVYPLTDDLVYMLQNGGEQQGWWDTESGSYRFGSVEGLNPSIAWMFACCYAAG